jgi:hypothetical protein
MKRTVDGVVTFLVSLLAIPSVMNKPMHDIENREITVEDMRGV